MDHTIANWITPATYLRLTTGCFERTYSGVEYFEFALKYVLRNTRVWAADGRGARWEEDKKVPPFRHLPICRALLLFLLPLRFHNEYGAWLHWEHSTVPIAAGRVQNGRKYAETSTVSSCELELIVASSCVEITLNHNLKLSNLSRGFAWENQSPWLTERFPKIHAKHPKINSPNPSTTPM